MWYYQGNPFTNAPQDKEGFVYVIHDLNNDMKYVGQKKFWSKRTRPPLKGYKRKRTTWVESDWQDYYGSSEKLKDMVQLFGKSAFERTILYLCESKSQMNYYETLEQFNRNVLFDAAYYNGIINCRITSRGLREIK